MEDKPTLVMMDDLGQAPPAVQAAVMQLVLARKINGHQISEHVSFMAATNGTAGGFIRSRSARTTDPQPPDRTRRKHLRIVTERLMSGQGASR